MQPPYRESAHRAAAKDAYDRPLVGGMKGARFGHWWRRGDGEEIVATYDSALPLRHAGSCRNGVEGDDDAARRAAPPPQKWGERV